MIYLAIVVGVFVAFIGTAMVLAARPLLDEPLSEEWRRTHVGDHGDGDLR